MADEVFQGKDGGYKTAVNLVGEKMTPRLFITKLGGRSYPDQFQVVGLENFVRFKNMQQAAFGAVTADEVIHQVILENRGVVYIAGNDRGENIGYAVVKTGELDEVRIQKELLTTHEHIRAGVDLWNLRFFHDHYDYDVPQGTVVLHEIGIIPSEQKKGYGEDLLRLVQMAFEREFGGKWWMAFVRINNISSITSLTRALGMSMIGIQGPPDEQKVKRLRKQIGLENLHGSLESNFRADNIVPSIDNLPDESRSGIVWNVGDSLAVGNHFFLPMSLGEQAELDSYPEVMAMLKMKMAYGRIPVEKKDYVMRKVCTHEELAKIGITSADPSIRYLYFTREWEY